MSARSSFESLGDDVARVAELEGRVEAARNAAVPHGEGSGGRGGGFGDPLAAVDAVIDSDAERELERARDSVNARMGMALAVLYGPDGRGGLAKARGSTDADLLCCRYLQGYGWARIARMMDAERGWCRMRAMRALAWLDRSELWATSGF